MANGGLRTISYFHELPGISGSASCTRPHHDLDDRPAAAGLVATGTAYARGVLVAGSFGRVPTRYQSDYRRLGYGNAVPFHCDVPDRGATASVPLASNHQSADIHYRSGARGCVVGAYAGLDRAWHLHSMCLDRALSWVLGFPADPTRIRRCPLSWRSTSRG